jgi:hypothetical protein
LPQFLHDKRRSHHPEDENEDENEEEFDKEDD